MARTLSRWDVDDAPFWEATGRRVAQRNLWVSIPNLLCGFSVWLLWSAIGVEVQKLHDLDPRLFSFTASGQPPLDDQGYRALLYLLPAVAGLAGATLRIPNAFMVAMCGGRNVVVMTTLLLIVPTLGVGFALQDPDIPFGALVVLAALSGVGGGAFASSMSNISFFFPKRMQGLALGLNAGLGNLGVSVMQFAVPYVILRGVFGRWGGAPQVGDAGPVWIANIGLCWVPILLVCLALAWLLMDNLPFHQVGSVAAGVGRFLWLEMLGLTGAAVGIALLLTLPFPEWLKIIVVMLAAVATTLLLLRFATPLALRHALRRQFSVLGTKHNWIMTWIYTMTFGSFIGYSAAFPKLISDVFGYARVDSAGHLLDAPQRLPGAPNPLTYAFLGALVGSLARPIGGWLSDRFGGARVTHWDTLVMMASTGGVAWCVLQARSAADPRGYFLPFLALFLVLFVTTGIGNGSTFRMIPVIFSKEQAGPVLGWTSAIAAYGSFLIPTIFAAQVKAGTPEYALYGFVAYYLSCLLLNWWYYARRGAEIAC